MLISVIIPVYCAERYLERCVASVLQQTLPCYEIILVDDESVDGSFMLCKDFEAKHAEIQLIQQKHAGVSAARNAGIQRATGDWLMFLDADDALTPDALQVLSAGVDSEIDAVCGMIHRGGLGIQKRKQQNGYARQLKGKTLINTVLAAPTDYLTIHGWLLRAEKVRNEKVQFDISLTLGEDSIMMLEMLLRCRSAVFLPQDVYLYTIAEQSTLHRWKPHQADAYKAMLKKAAVLSNAYSEWPTFVLTTLLLILTHDTFHPGNPQRIFKQLREARHLCGQQPFLDAFARADLSGLPLSRRTVLVWMKNGWTILAWVGVKIRQWQNQRKANARYGLI